MRLKLEFSFEEIPNDIALGEARVILDRVAEQLEYTNGDLRQIKDDNGNCIGHWLLIEDE